MAVKKLEKIKRPARLGFLSYLGDAQGCGTIRIIYPYLLLNHFRLDQLVAHSSYLSNFVSDPNFYKNFSFVQFQRSATKEHLNIFQFFKLEVQKKLGTPLVYEIDDLLLGIPEWNFASGYYKQNEEHVKKIISMADAVVVSTKKLKEIYSQFNKRIAVIQNHLPKFIWGDIYPKHLNEPREVRPRILWAGSQNHFAPKPMVDRGVTGGDFGNRLLNFIRKTTDKYDWCFIGAMPEELKDLKEITFLGWKEIFQFPHAMKEVEPDICIAPLEDSVFNACKSNIKQLEFVAAGAPGVYSDVEPYKKAYLRAKNDDQMIAHIERLAEDIDFRARVYKKDRQAVGNQLFWEESNNIRKYVNTYLNLFGKKL